jgi:hypothetical protein
MRAARRQAPARLGQRGWASRTFDMMPPTTITASAGRRPTNHAISVVAISTEPYGSSSAPSSGSASHRASSAITTANSAQA